MLLLKFVKNNSRNDVANTNNNTVNTDSINEGIYSISRNLNKQKKRINKIILKKNALMFPEVNPFLLSGVSKKKNASSGCGRASGLHGISGIRMEMRNCL